MYYIYTRVILNAIIIFYFIIKKYLTYFTLQIF